MTITTRIAEMRDLPFLDALQKKHSRQLGFFPRAQMEGYVRSEWVLIAEDSATRQPLGYCASRDRYLKRDELGVIYQLCVSPAHQRGLIGATLIKSVFERAAYGCRLFCCWCAQDLEANYFWESLGFVPIAFRAGSTGKRRVHIFWQRRVDRGRVDRESGSEVGGSRSETEDFSSNDPQPTTHDPRPPAAWWYPFQTNAGALRADRLVFPIPPGVHWKDVKPIEIPTVARASRPCLEGPKKNMGETPMRLEQKKPQTQNSANTVAIIVGGRVKYVPKPGAKPGLAKAPKPKRAKPQKTTETLTFDPRFLKQNRELRDRYLEHVNDRLRIAPCAKYDVSRTLSGVEGSRALADAHVFKAALPSPAAA
jgi:hypothetical protein